VQSLFPDAQCGSHPPPLPRVPQSVAAVEPRDAIFPGSFAPVVRNADDFERELVQLSWGFVLPQARKAPRRVTNTRDDKVQSSFWRDSVRLRRCLVPSSFCEPNSEVKPATWNWFSLKGDEPRPLFAFAGIWRRHQGPIKKEGPSVSLDVFSFMTTTPNALVATVNRERMPVLLATEVDHEAWLNGSVEEALALVMPIPCGAHEDCAVGIRQAGQASVVPTGLD
jgi:putative SOS response-associated peptidase YedK